MICILNWKLAVQQKGSSAFSASVKVLATQASDCPWQWASTACASNYGSRKILPVPRLTFVGICPLVCSWHVLWHYFLAPPHCLCDVLPLPAASWGYLLILSSIFFPVPLWGKEIFIHIMYRGTSWQYVGFSCLFQVSQTMSKNAWSPCFWDLNAYSDTRPPFLCAGLKNHCFCLQSNTSKLN